MIKEVKDVLAPVEKPKAGRVKRKKTINYLAGYKQDSDGIFMPYYHCVHVDALYVRKFPCSFKPMLKIKKKRTVDLLEYILNEMGEDNVITIDGKLREGFSKHIGMEVSRQSMYSYKQDLVKNKILIKREVKDYLIDPNMFSKANSSDREKAIVDTIVYGPNGVGMSSKERAKIMKENRKLIGDR